MKDKNDKQGLPFLFSSVFSKKRDFKKSFNATKIFSLKIIEITLELKKRKNKQTQLLQRVLNLVRTLHFNVINNDDNDEKKMTIFFNCLSYITQRLFLLCKKDIKWAECTVLFTIHLTLLLPRSKRSERNSKGCPLFSLTIAQQPSFSQQPLQHALYT